MTCSLCVICRTQSKADAMELMSRTNARQEPSGGTLQSIEQSNDKMSLETRAACGAAPEFFGSMTPANIESITANPCGERKNGRSPELVKLLKAYGERPVLANLKMFTAYVRMMTDQNWSDTDVQIIANTIANTAEARLMWYSTLIGFFQWLVDGHCPLYQSKPHNVLVAFQLYAKEALKRQRDMQEQIDEERRKQEYEAHLRNSITWEAYKASRGLVGENPLTAMMR